VTQVRAATVDDVPAYLELRRENTPWQVSTPAGIEHHWAVMRTRPGGEVFAVDDDEGLAGVAWSMERSWTAEPGATGAFVIVAPRARGRGLGSRLLDTAENHLRQHGGRRVLGWVRNDQAMIDWLRHRGYETSAEARFSRAMLDALPPMPDVPAGVTTMSLEELGPEAAYQVDSASMLDEPSDMPLDKVEYDEWLREAWGDPNQCLDLGVAVLVDGVPAACSFVEGDRASGRMHSGGTGTLREFRGRGLAKIAKSVALRRARDAGFTEAYTANDEVNAPMLAINEWLGYQPVGAEWSCLKTLGRRESSCEPPL